MKNYSKIVMISAALSCTFTWGQTSRETTVGSIMTETYNNSELERLAYELLDGIGPRLVGSPKMQQSHDWAVNQFKRWGIEARNEQWGEWKSWERGPSYIEMVHPYAKSLEGMQLAFSPATPSRGITADVLMLPIFGTKEEFTAWLPKVKGKLVMVSPYQSSGRPDYNWKEFATPESYNRMKKDSEEASRRWQNSIKVTGETSRTMNQKLEEAGAAGIISSNWSRGFGVNKIFSAGTKKIPVVDISLEDYGQLYRMTQHGTVPRIKIQASSKDRGMAPTFNTVAEIKGTEKPDEYIILSAHLDSWDGGTGATDNGTGTITMMEVARILKKVYPNPKRSIIVGLWGSEEQGLNGSRAYVSAHKDQMPKIQAVFNQDNGTGRVANISGQGFLHSYDYLNRWLNAVPKELTKDIKTTFPGTPGGGGSDHASFVAAGVPAFMLGSLNWSYGNYTWHTNRDTYDKIVFDDVKSNVALIAILTYMASEDPEKASGERIKLPLDERTGQPMKWPELREPTRKGGLD
ncbi:M20/M25/M40 family metallo-hydrolase [Kaistella sp. PBT33-4]|uniref:M20/M25/M40 family metallo-hydrolase n=1 Tax=Kaistella sp. PBT33-4 TaxID=3032000 RepID=UPI0023D8B032|nr:M20/M25/M40 family metallo-hydrolase [Kaistella sp. PBT33-4]MDF0720655.1 M20/M25/M40 family metallo-hydrolase [Kaistella sp. PBT33-4]